jgi:hypothetical protein
MMEHQETRDIESLWKMQLVSTSDTSDLEIILTQFKASLTFPLTCSRSDAINLCRDFCSAIVQEWLQHGNESKNLKRAIHVCDEVVAELMKDLTCSKLWAGQEGFVWREQLCYLLTHVIFIQTCYAANKPSNKNSIAALSNICAYLKQQLKWITKPTLQRSELLSECISVFSYHSEYRYLCWELWHHLLSNARRPRERYISTSPTAATAYSLTHLTVTLSQAFLHLHIES